MAKLIYLITASLDGFLNDEEGSFDFTEPDDEVHAFIDDRVRGIGTFLFGRRMYEVMAVWDDPETIAGQPDPMRDFAEIWSGADKIVHSRSLAEASTERTRIVRDFDPQAVREMKASADRDLAIAGPGLAAHAFRAGLVDEVQLFLVPVVVGGGTRALPTGIRFRLELADERRFGNGTVFLRYRVTG